MDDDREDSEGDGEENRRRGQRQLRTSDNFFSSQAKGKLP